MPLFMDVHETLPAGATAHDVAAAHRADLDVQQRHDVRYLRYRVDEEAGNVFCLAEAPSGKAATAVHHEAHGLLANYSYEVVEGE